MNIILLKRCLAFTIDWLIIGCIMVFVLLINPNFSIEYLMYPSIDSGVSINIFVSMAFVLVAIIFKDFIFGDASIGKKVFGLRVVTKNSDIKPTKIQLIKRNLLLFIPQIEFFVLLFNKGRRIGDIIANTEVK